MAELSILIPARNEMFLRRTCEDILANIEADTEIIVVLDGAKADPPLPYHERLNYIYHPKAVGQRAATNEAARLASGKYVIKVDAHCAFDKGFDRKMLEAIDGHDNWTMVPVMYNLHAFDWVCPDGHRRYQSPSGPCQEILTVPSIGAQDVVCGKPTQREMVWKRRKHKRSTSYSFDSEPHFQYFNEYTRRPEYKGDITKTMSLQGSFFMMTKEKYFELNICDESFGSWGSQGIEVACKTWLSGGEVMVNHKTWYAHLFRTQGGDFGFPYKQDESKIRRGRKAVRELFFDNKWQKQIRPLSWLLEEFWPVEGWTKEDFDRIKAWPLQGKNDAQAI